MKKSNKRLLGTFLICAAFVIIAVGVFSIVFEHARPMLRLAPLLVFVTVALTTVGLYLYLWNAEAPAGRPPLHERKRRKVNNFIKFVVGLVVLLVLCTLGFFVVYDWKTVEGNEIAVTESWNGGVEADIHEPRTYFYNRWMTKYFVYNMSPHSYVMNDRGDDERSNGRKHDPMVAKSADNQKMTLNLAVQWKFDHTKMIDTHKLLKAHEGVKDWEDIVEERVVRPALMAATNTEVSSRRAIDAYSGEGFVKMQQAILTKLQDPQGSCAAQGIRVEVFVIEHISLDEAYIGEINKRQVAEMRELRAKQEEKAAMAEAQRAKAEAQSDYEKQLVEARREKEQVILKSESAAQQQINEAKAAVEKVELAAKADAYRVVTAATAERQAAEAKAAAIFALGEAEAKARTLNLTAYNSPGADRYVQIEVAKSFATGVQNIHGLLPSNASYTFLADSFTNAVSTLLRPTTAPAPEPK